MRSLQTKLATGLIISLVLIFSVLWFVVSASIQTLAEGYVASRLQHDAEMLLSQLEIDPQGKIKLLQEANDSVYKQPFSGHYYQIQSKAQIIHSRSLWDKLLEQEKVSPGQQLSRYQAGPQGQLLLVVHYAFVKQGQQIIVSVAEDLNPVKAGINRFKTQFGALAVILLITLLALQIIILRRSLGSLRHIRDELRLLQTGEISQLSKSPLLELHPMVDEINQLLESLTQRLRRSRDSLGDLTHAIKRPLTVIQQFVEQDRTLPAQVKQDMLEQLQMINQLTERTLKRASLAGDQHAIGPFSFQQDIDALLKTLRLMYRDRDLDIEVFRDKAISFRIDRQDMLELLGNCLDNACKWASHKVALRVEQMEGLLLIIEDDGPGANTESLAQMAQRGTRLDENKPGYGLGLAIAADIVREYGGEIHYTRSSSLGGFRVEIRLPFNN